jgi:ribosomal-protein-alanine N-acetyltransferase
LPTDRESFAAMNVDPRVMEYFLAPWPRQRSERRLANAEAHFNRYGFGKWAVEIPGITPFAGYVGLEHVDFEAPFTAPVEIGWRFIVPFWNKGYDLVLDVDEKLERADAIIQAAHRRAQKPGA